MEDVTMYDENTVYRVEGTHRSLSTGKHLNEKPPEGKVFAIGRLKDDENIDSYVFRREIERTQFVVDLAS